MTIAGFYKIFLCGIAGGIFAIAALAAAFHVSGLTSERRKRDMTDERLKAMRDQIEKEGYHV